MAIVEIFLPWVNQGTRYYPDCGPKVFPPEGEHSDANRMNLIAGPFSGTTDQVGNTVGVIEEFSPWLVDEKFLPEIEAYIKGKYPSLGWPIDPSDDNQFLIAVRRGKGYADEEALDAAFYWPGIAKSTAKDALLQITARGLNQTKAQSILELHGLPVDPKTSGTIDDEILTAKYIFGLGKYGPKAVEKEFDDDVARGYHSAERAAERKADLAPLLEAIAVREL